MTHEKKPATLLRPDREYEDYKTYCEKESLEILDEIKFYKSYAHLAVRVAISGMTEDGIASYDLGDTILCLCQMSKETMVLAIFNASELEDLKKEESEVDPLDHLG